MKNLFSSNKLYRLKRIFIFSLISFIITAVLVLIRYRYNLQNVEGIQTIVLFGISFGLLLGILEDSLLYSSISKWDYKYRTLLKIFLIPLLILFLFFIIPVSSSNENLKDLTIGEGLIFNRFIGIFENAVILDIFLLTFLTTIFNEINLILGDNFLLNYILGNIKGPIKENRIFMFLDLKDSTTIAEQIGDVKFFELLNDCYTMLGTISISRKAEIVKYVGDEAILTWKYNSGKNSRNCIHLFFEFQQLLNSQKKYFIKKYGFQPKFTAAAHHGSVISAYLGSVKRQKDYSGDVMNTTARIEGMTTKYNAEFLISEALFQKLKMKEHEGEKIESISLKGKASPINIYKLA